MQLQVQVVTARRSSKEMANTVNTTAMSLATLVLAVLLVAMRRKVQVPVAMTALALALAVVAVVVIASSASQADPVALHRAVTAGLPLCRLHQVVARLYRRPTNQLAGLPVAVALPVAAVVAALLVAVVPVATVVRAVALVLVVVMVVTVEITAMASITRVLAKQALAQAAKQAKAAVAAATKCQTEWCWCKSRPSTLLLHPLMPWTSLLQPAPLPPLVVAVAVAVAVGCHRRQQNPQALTAPSYRQAVPCLAWNSTTTSWASPHWAPRLLQWFLATPPLAVLVRMARAARPPSLTCGPLTPRRSTWRA